MTERLIFENSVAGMLRCLSKPIEPSMLIQLTSIGINPHKLKPAYTVDEYMKLMNVLGAHKYSHLQEAERDYELGRDFIKGFFDTMIGKALFSVAKVLGPLRGTRRLPRSMKSVNNYTEAGITEFSEREVEVWITPAFRPHFYVGLFEESGKLMFGPKYQVNFKSFENEKGVFRISW
jgi:uncharacterized protein (TIGR02265 family)